MLRAQVKTRCFLEPGHGVLAPNAPEHKHTGTQQPVCVSVRECARVCVSARESMWDSLLVQAQEKWGSGCPLCSILPQRGHLFSPATGPPACVAAALTDTAILGVRGPREESGAGPGGLAEWKGVGSPPADTVAERGGCASARPPRKRVVPRSLHQVQQGRSRKTQITCYCSAKKGETQI